MPITVWLRIMGGDMVETAKDAVSDVNADMGEQYRPGSVVDRAGGVDWADIGKRAGGAAKGGLGFGLKVGGPMIIMAAAEWFLDGALELLADDANKPAADALAELGDALLTVIAKVIAPMIPLLLRAIKAVYPVLTAIADMVIDVMPYATPALELAAAVLELAADLAVKLWRTLQAIGRRLTTTWGRIQTALRKVERAITGLIDGVTGAFATLLAFVLEHVLGPLKSHLDNLSRLWDEWSSAYLQALEDAPHRTAGGYTLNGTFYAWGTGPYSDMKPIRGGRVIEHPVPEAQLVAAIADYARANGGLARALWAPA